MSFYDDLEKSLCEAIQMEKGNVPMILKEDMPAPTYTTYTPYTNDNIQLQIKNTK